MNINKVSNAVSNQLPDFISTEYELFTKFVEYYYKSQEKTGLGQNILNNLLGYLDIDQIDVDILDGSTTLVGDITSGTTTISVENVQKFLSENGTVLIGDEVIFYENVSSAPNVSFSPGISYEQVKLKQIELQSPLKSFDGTTRSFALTAEDRPIGPPSVNHLIVQVYGEYLIPGLDYTISGTNIVFTTAPRAVLTSDSADLTSIKFYSGFLENTIGSIDNISSSFGDGASEFKITVGGTAFVPEVDEYVIVYYDGNLLIPKVDYIFDGNIIIFRTFVPIKGRKLDMFHIEASIPSYGNNASAFARVSNIGSLENIAIDNSGSGYRFEFPPQIRINSEIGSGGAATALINGVKNLQLISGGVGYSDTNPPIVKVVSPTSAGSTTAKITAKVSGGTVTELTLEDSGSGYTDVPRVTFQQPGGATLGDITVSNGSISGTIAVTFGGIGYSTPPEVYVDEPTGANSIKANLQAVLNASGEVASISILNPGQGYTSTPRVKIIEPIGAQVLDTTVDTDGRVTGIEILDGGSGYSDIPSVYIIDDRTSDTGAYIGGSGAKATASIFNGRITDINITNFGTGYSETNPPKVVIQAPPQASASVDIGVNEITGFKILQSGRDYTKAQLLNCARAASGITGYTENGNAIFSRNTTASSATSGTVVKCLDAVFVKRILDKYTEQFLPDVPEIDYKKIDVRTAIKNIKDFYMTKGTTFSIAYLFKLLYGETVDISYPRDQIIKPSAATWSINTILRATLESGDPRNIQDALIQQDADIADTNVRDASALVENYIAINTANTTIYELVLSEETIQGSFIVPYKTKLAEPLNGTDSIITVDSTIGWPERNGEFVLGGAEVIRYKEKSLNQFIECTRLSPGSVGTNPYTWDSATEVVSNFGVTLNKGTSQEVTMNIVGIVDAQQTNLTDTGSYYLPGDKLTVAKLGGTGEQPLLNTWLYNVKKLIQVSDIVFGGVNDQFATVTCNNPHGLLVGDEVTIYGANPILYNGTFAVTSRDSDTVFQYQLPQTALVAPQGNILVSVNLNKGKSTDSSINDSISVYTTNIQNSFFNDSFVYVASTGIPNYNVGPFPGSALLPGNQRKLNRFPQIPTTISTKNVITPGPIGTWVNGVSVWSYKSTTSKTFGPITSIGIDNAGILYDSANPPKLTLSSSTGTGATAEVVVNGSVINIEVETGGSGYTSSPLVSIVGGGGSGASATAIITKGSVSNILITDGGTGYTSQPQITIVGGSGTGATGTASVRGPIKSVNLLSGGTSYTSSPNVTISSGQGAVAQAIVNNGRIISIAIISGGSGYTTAPEVQIQGVGFGAKARAVIDTEGENAGKVTSIEILNRGINYVQGTTVISLSSIGQGASFTANVFQWTYNLQESSTLDSSQGAVFAGYNNQYGGEYAHIANPQRLRFILGDNLFTNTSNQIRERETQLTHSPIIGWAFDGNPIYGPYGYSDPTNQSSTLSRVATSYRLKTNLILDATTNPNPSRVEGPALTDDAAGTYVEDYEYVFGLGDLDQYNGRFCKTPEYPNGRYCYFVTIDNTEFGNSVFPYILGSDFNSVVDSWNLNESATQQNIPTGVVRYRDPYENVDIDVERIPNASTNSLTLEDGTLLLFDVEDENKDGIISQDEIDDPDQILEEPPLQIFDYFPKVKTESKVDIEVETISRFENASITDFVVENSGVSYQVDDKLIFDNSGTGGSGASARVSRIKGETISSYNYEYRNGSNYGKIQTAQPHNLTVGDSVFVDYSENIETTNKQYSVRQFKGVEEIVIAQTGSGYSEEIPPQIVIDGDGVDAELEAVVDSVGAIKRVNILNSGNGYTKNPRVILSHPQVFKKSDYYVSKVDNQEYVKINDSFVNAAKETYICGQTLDASGNTVAFVAKLSAAGVKEWEKTLELTTGLNYAEFQKLYVDGDTIWVAGINKPNGTILDSYNPDIIIAKYTQANDGLSATLTFQKAYAGISGGTRSDNISKIIGSDNNRVIIAGYTNTNSPAPYDGFIAVLDSTGTFTVKRKIASSNGNEKVTDLLYDNNNNLYFLMETSTSQNAGDINFAIGKATISTTSITTDWIKEITNNAYSFLDTSFTIDEFNEIYVSSTLQLKSDDATRDRFWVGKFDSEGVSVWNYNYAVSRDINLVPSTTLDIFNQLNVAYTKVDNTTSKKTINTVKIDYKGNIVNHTTTDFTENTIEGITANSLSTDTSGDAYVFGQTSWNRNEAIFKFDGNLTDETGHHTLTTLGLSGSIENADNILKIYGFQTGQSTTFENSGAKIAGTSLGTALASDFTIDFLIYKDAANSKAETLSADQQTLIAIGDASDTTGGLWLYYNTDGTASDGRVELVVANNSTAISASSAGTGTNTGLFANDTWQLISLRKSGNNFKVYVNSIEQISGNVSDTNLASKDIHIGNIPGFPSSGGFIEDNQGQFYVDSLRIRNRAVTVTAPSDFGSPAVLPVAAAVGLTHTFVDTAWFTQQHARYDYIDYLGFGIKVDKNADAVRLGSYNANTTTNYGFTRTAVTPVTGNSLTLNSVGYTLADVGLQSLDFNEATTTMSEGTETLTYTKDTWSTRTATVPSPGSQKLKVTANVKNRYYFETFNLLKIDNVQELTINQNFIFTVGSKLVLKNGSSFVNSGYITRVDYNTKKVYLAINSNPWSNDLNQYQLSTEQFSEQSTYGIIGPVPTDSANNEIAQTFADVTNTTPGTFDIDLANYNAPEDVGGTNNLDEYGVFKPYSDDDYSIKIVEVSGSSSYSVGSVVNITSGDISFNAAYSTAQITNLTGVLKISLIANLTKILQVTSVSNTDTAYAISGSLHYLSVNTQMYIDGNPSEEVSGTVYDEYDGSFPVERIISPVEFTYKLPQTALTLPATSASSVKVFVKSPTLKMYYGHQYLFDLSHSSMLGGNLSFSKDPLYKLEYSFNSIQRIGTPGVTGQGVATPTVKLKVTRDVITNISYYFDPSRTGADSPVIPESYLDVTFSPYVGTFTVFSTSGGSITRGDDIFQFELINQPEGPATIANSSYSTSSKKAVGSISNIRIVNPGGFYTKLPIVSSIQSTRNIERVQINDPGTEYAVGVYNSVPISGDGEGGLVSITVSDGADEEGGNIPGQIQKVVVTSPGKGYTTATIDIESINGILGPGLTGSGAELVVVIPSFGSGASIFTLGEEIGKIKNLKNNNFGFDYSHDYTLRPEISFPINAQLTSTSILDSITVTDPGSGYTQAPTVVVTGGGGSGAIAAATIKNGRLFAIEVKDPGSGYSSTPVVTLKSSFNYVVNLDLGILQFAFPHGIQNGAEITLNVVDTGEGAEFPIAAGAIGRLNGSNTYYAISGAANSLEDDQLKIAITSANATLGDALTFTNTGTGRQQVLTTSFGGTAVANVITSTFLEGELVYQGDTLENATAQGYVSTNSGWQVGPRIVKLVNYTGTFTEGQTITGVISKSSGVISKLKIARGVLEVGSITKTTGQFIDDVGKPSEIIQKIQDSYYYQDFSYAVKSSVSISEWKDIVVRNVHPASFKIFGELSISDYATIPNKETDFELTKSVELANEAIVPNIQNFTLVEPVYSEFDNTVIQFRQKRLTSSENILTSVVQRLDDISSQFDGVKTQFSITVNNGDAVIANANQLMVILNGVVQTPEVSFTIQSDSIVFSEPPSPPASVKYVSVQIDPIAITEATFISTSGIVPNIGNVLSGTGSGAKFTVTKVTGVTINNVSKELIEGFFTIGTAFSTNELVLGNTTGFSAVFESSQVVPSNNLFVFGESVTDLQGDTAVVEDINLQKGSETPLAKLRYGVGPSTTGFEIIGYNATINAPSRVEGVFTVGQNYQIGSEIVQVSNIVQNTDSTTLTVVRGQLGTVVSGIQELTPLYGTNITVTNDLILSKTVGTYQSKPGLYDVILDDIIVGAKSRVVARITSTTPYRDAATNEVIPEVEISEGSSFFGLLFSRLSSITYPNIVLDDISQSQIAVVDFTDNNTDFNVKFPENEIVNNYIIPYNNSVGTFQDDEFIRNYKIEFGNESGDFTTSEDLSIRKLSLTNPVGGGFFSLGQVLRTRDTKAEIIGFNQAAKTIYLGKIGRTKSYGGDHHAVTFIGNAELDTAQKKFGSSSLSVPATGDGVSIATSDDFGFGTAAFTLDVWVRASALSGDHHILDMRDNSGDSGAIRLYVASTGQVRVNIGGSDIITSSNNIVIDTWYHIAVSRSGTSLKLFVDGTEVGSVTNSTNLGTTKTIKIGSDVSDANGFLGHIDDFRVSNLARYTAAFTVRSGMFQGDINAKLLLHFDGTDTQTYTDDWSGAQDFTKGEFFNNDAILATTRANSNTAVVTGFTGNSQRYYDAANLLEKNKNFIAKETVYLLTQQYPSLTIPGGNVNCEDDVVDIVEAIIEDVRNGSNNHIWDAAALYVDRTVSPITLNHIETEIAETIWAYNKVGDMIPYIINNVLWTVSGSHGLTQFTDTTITDSNNTVYSQFTPTAATYDSATGVMVLTIGTHSLTTSSQVGISPGSIVFTCSSDNNITQHAYPRTDDPFYNKVLAITATTATTITVNVGASPTDRQYAHTFVSSSTNAVKLLNYTTGDCADVASTSDNLLDILIDTLTNANLSTPVDHLGAVTKVSPAVEFKGATVDGFYKVALTADSVDNTNDILYSNKIGAASEYRFKDASTLIRANRQAIVDKAASDMLTRYPDLATSMPRNANGTSTDGTERCKQDLGLILDDIAADIELGGNKNVASTSRFYVGVNNELQHIRLQVWQSVYAHERLGFYAKQAINGDLTTDNTDQLIIGDWGITNDAGQCADVQSAIDNLITLLNDTIAPTGEDFNIAADRIHFNRDYIASEATGRLDAEFTYVLNNVSYRAFNYPNGSAGLEKCKRDLKLILTSAISDLQTGGNNSTIRAIELYLTANLQLDHIEEQLSATIFAIEQLRDLGISAIQNLLYTTGAVTTGSQYAAVYATETAYRDALSVTDVQAVMAKYGELIDIAIRILSPAGLSGRYASQILLFNKNYYRTEITNTINNQFGANSWQYDSFIDGLVDNLSHDIIITDTSSSNKTTSRRITLQREGVVSELQFTAGADYQSVPTIAFTAPASGVTATAVATLEAAGPISAINVASGGSGYTVRPDVTLTGANIGDDGATATISGGAVSAVTYDGSVWDADTAIEWQTSSGFGPGSEIQDAGTGTGTTGGFDGVGKYILFGAASGDRYAITTRRNTTDMDNVRVYVTAGNGSNGGESPDAGEDLALYYKVQGSNTEVLISTLIYGGAAGGGSNYTNFTDWTAITVALPTGAKGPDTAFIVRQSAQDSGANDDHYGLKRVSVIDTAKEFQGTVTIAFADGAEQSVTTTAATANFITLREVSNVSITNPGTGYDPSTPPTVTISGGNPTTAMTISNINVVLDTTRFNNGETITSSGGGSATVLEDIGNAVYIGVITGTLFADGDTLTGGTSGVSSTIPSSGVGSTFDYYTNVGNVLTFNDARLIQSPIAAEFSSTNFWTNPEAFAINWTTASATFTNNAILSPDNTLTAEKITADASGTVNHDIDRVYTLNAFETFDSGSVKFDTTNETFDTGSIAEDSTQTFTTSLFVKSAEYTDIRFSAILDDGQAGPQSLFFDVDLTNGSTGSIFQPEAGLVSYTTGVVPFGNGWYRVFATLTFSFGFSSLTTRLNIKNASAINYPGDGSSGIYVWGAKFNKGAFDAYTSVGGERFFSNSEYNIKNFALNLFEDYVESALNGSLASPTANGSYAFDNATWRAGYSTDEFLTVVRRNVDFYKKQLDNSTYYADITVNSGISVPTKEFGITYIPTGVGGGLSTSDYFYGEYSDTNAELETSFMNEAKIAKVYNRFRIDGDITDGPFTMGEIVQKDGDSSVTGVVYGFHEDENYKYLDVEITGGTWAIADGIIGAANTTTATLSALESRLHIIRLKGTFTPSIPFLGFTSSTTATPTSFIRNETAVLDNTGGKLTVDTSTLTGTFEKTAVVYSSNTELYIEVQKYNGLDVQIGDKIISGGYTRLGVANATGFILGHFIYLLNSGGGRDTSKKAIISGVDTVNNYLYVSPIDGDFSITDNVGDFGPAGGGANTIATGTIATKLVQTGQAYGLIGNITSVGVNKRLYLRDVIGIWNENDSVIAGKDYKSVIIDKVISRARVKRSFRGFDGTQTIFDLSISNGTTYLPDPAGHMLIFINGILQPPGAGNAYNAFSNKIQFAEAPDAGSTFTGFYIGKLRQLDDISFEFDSLRQSFNLKRNDVFYSLTLTEGVQSSVIRPENNIIVSLNGVIQEPGVGFEIVGSRIIFSEIPRVGSSFAAFSYVGSEADVDASEVVPPIEPGDFIDIQGETEDREVAVIESSNSLITFDYLGSVFGQNAKATPILKSGFIEKVSITAPGSGYTSRPVVRVDSISGFDAQIRAIIGINVVEIGNVGSAYKETAIVVESEVPDDWTAPNLADYGEEYVDYQ